jgi:hypothetical protein
MLSKLSLLTERHVIMEDTGCGFSALIASDGWLSSMEQENIFFVGIVMVSLMAASRKANHGG